MKESSAVLAEVAASRAEERVALGAVLFSLGVFAALAPFAQIPLARQPAFIPLYQAALVLNDVITAALLFAQCRVSRSRAVFILGCGYLFTGCMIVAHTLTFPGLFAPQGLLGAGVQSTAWIYMFWHALFPLFVIAYARSSDKPLTARAAANLAGCAILLAGALVGLATMGEGFLPAIMTGDSYRPAYHFVVGLVWLCSAGALVALWRKRLRTVLDLWLMVVMCAWLCEIALAAMLNAGRFDLGFYAGRVFGLAAASFVLCVLVFETSLLHARSAAAAEEQKARAEAEAANRAKDQFLAMLGHELRNPLSPIVTSLQIMRIRDPNAFASERGIIERQVGNLTRLVDELLDVSRLAQGKCGGYIERARFRRLASRAPAKAAAKSSASTACDLPLEKRQGTTS